MDGETGPVKLTFDTTPAGGSPGVLLGFVEATEARRLGALPAPDRRRQVLESFARYFGDPVDGAVQSSERAAREVRPLV